MQFAAVAQHLCATAAGDTWKINWPYMHAGKQRSLKMWLAGGGPASQRSQVLESEDSLPPETPATARAASGSGMLAPSQAQTESTGTDSKFSRLSTQRELSGGDVHPQLLPKRQEPLPRAPASAAGGRKGKRSATTAGESRPDCLHALSLVTRASQA